MIDIDKLLSSISYERTGLRIILQEYYDEFNQAHKKIGILYSSDELDDLANYLYQLRTALIHIEEYDSTEKLIAMERICRREEFPTPNQVITLLTSVFTTNKQIESTLTELRFKESKRKSNYAGQFH
ncbi:hypothetical protein [Vibrio comitans]|uniref:Uncharacterized protein n=1 Tax=Vibrio comitans NBRC 102076 TaxID=1219078 RepID=A0A4Y3IRV9_9VIBR|nr:hypothetical protein [Vibrio comitans]GEA61937.1 hypothetical protein VCO01S_31300 [Vibrio comitans NBRC 102076]